MNERYRGRRRQGRVLIAAALVLVLPALPVSGQNCVPFDHTGEYESRFGRAEGALTQQGLRALLENPTVIEATATTTSLKGADLQTVTDTHAVYPIDPGNAMRVLNDTDSMTEWVPDLGYLEQLCDFGDQRYRQLQRVRVPVLFFAITTEYVIDIEHVDNGPDVYSAHWVLFDSPDGKTAYVYGSWYYEAVTLDGQRMTYARNFSKLGLKTRIPGSRFIVQTQLRSKVERLFEALYEQTVREFGRTARGG